MFTRRTTILAAAIAAATIAAPQVFAQAAWPTAKPITIVVSYPAGGDTDNLGRVFAEQLSARLKQNVVVENRPGASGTIGNTYVANAAPDGYTLLMTPNTISIATLVLKAKPAYDVLTAFTPIIEVGNQSLFVAANKQSGLKDMKSLVEGEKAGTVKSYASPGAGSPMHILGALFNAAAGTKIEQIPYRGSAPAIVDLLGNQVPMTYTTIGPVSQHLANGNVSLLAVADKARSPLAPNVPTLLELGYKDAEVGAWQAIMAPKGLPESIQKALNAHMNDIIKMPEVVAKMRVMGVLPSGGAPEVLAKRNEFDHKRYAVVIKDFGISAE